MTTIDLYADVACVHSYLGYSQLRRALSQVRARQVVVDVRVQPFLIVPTEPIGEYESLQDRHRRMFGPSWRETETQMEHRGASVGAPINFGKVKFTSTILAHAAIQQVQAVSLRHGETLLARLFVAYFADGSLISDTNWLRSLCSDEGLQTPTLTNDEYNRVLGLDQKARQNGISVAPTLQFPDGYRIVGARSTEEYEGALTTHS